MFDKSDDVVHDADFLGQCPGNISGDERDQGEWQQGDASDDDGERERNYGYVGEQEVIGKSGKIVDGDRGSADLRRHGNRDQFPKVFPNPGSAFVQGR